MVRRRTVAPVAAAVLFVLAASAACGSDRSGPARVGARPASDGPVPAAAAGTPAPVSPTAATVITAVPGSPLAPAVVEVPEQVPAAAAVPAEAGAPPADALAPAAAPAPAFEAAAARVPGVDVSKWQPAIDWPEVRSAGHRFAFVAAVGSYGVNPHFREQWDGASAAGLHRGAYFFADPTRGTGRGDAARLLAMAGDLRDGSTLPPMLDVERHHSLPPCDGVSPAAWSTYIRSFLAEVTARVGRTPIIYTAANFWRTCLADSREFSHTTLFAAQPRVAYPRPFAGWPRVTFWQHSVGRVPGIAADADQDTFLGGLADLRSLLVPRA